MLLVETILVLAVVVGAFLDKNRLNNVGAGDLGVHRLLKDKRATFFGFLVSTSVSMRDSKTRRPLT